MTEENLLVRVLGSCGTMAKASVICSFAGKSVPFDPLSAPIPTSQIGTLPTSATVALCLHPPRQLPSPNSSYGDRDGVESSYHEAPSVAPPSSQDYLRTWQCATQTSKGTHTMR